jgi:hypothetical protein
MNRETVASLIFYYGKCYSTPQHFPERIRTRARVLPLPLARYARVVFHILAANPMTLGPNRVTGPHAARSP